MPQEKIQLAPRAVPLSSLKNKVSTFETNFLIFELAWLFFLGLPMP